MYVCSVLQLRERELLIPKVLSRTSTIFDDFDSRDSPMLLKLAAWNGKLKLQQR